jgi:transcriptional regulator with XRE-family HTH domain
MENILRDRVRQYCEYMNIRISQFEKKAGLSNGYFNQVSKKPSNAKLESIAEAHPLLNIDWLCTGRGDMINSGISQTSNGDNTIQVSGNNVDMRNINQSKSSHDDARRIKELEERIEELLEDKKRLQGVIDKLLEKI